MHREKIISLLKEVSRTGNAELPEDIGFELNHNILTMTLKNRSSYGYLGILPTDDKYTRGRKNSNANMQNDPNAFEAWAIAIYANLGREHVEKVILTIDADSRDHLVNFKPGTYQGHYGRFLYRALRFSQQYKWFELSPELNVIVTDFDEFLKKSEHSFINNYSTKEAGVSHKRELETEANFAGVPYDHENPYYASKNRKSELKSLFKKHGKIDIDEDDIYRQLVVGLHLEDANEKDICHDRNRIFTGTGAAVDLWTISGDTLIPIELKTKNSMIGAITELFFYSNYLYDVYIEENRIHPANKKGTKGYNRIYKASTDKKLKKVMGFLLLDDNSLHTLITDKAIAEMNNSSQPNISYGSILSYECEPK